MIYNYLYGWSASIRRPLDPKSRNLPTDIHPYFRSGYWIWTNDFNLTKIAIYHWYKPEYYEVSPGFEPGTQLYKSRMLPTTSKKPFEASIRFKLMILHYECSVFSTTAMTPFLINYQYVKEPLLRTVWDSNPNTNIGSTDSNRLWGS